MRNTGLRTQKILEASITLDWMTRTSSNNSCWAWIRRNSEAGVPDFSYEERNSCKLFSTYFQELLDFSPSSIKFDGNIVAVTLIKVEAEIDDVSWNFAGRRITRTRFRNFDNVTNIGTITKISRTNSASISKSCTVTNDNDGFWLGVFLFLEWIVAHSIHTYSKFLTNYLDIIIKINRNVDYSGSRSLDNVKNQFRHD